MENAPKYFKWYVAKDNQALKIINLSTNQFGNS